VKAFGVLGEKQLSVVEVDGPDIFNEYREIQKVWPIDVVPVSGNYAMLHSAT